MTSTRVARHSWIERVPEQLIKPKISECDGYPPGAGYSCANFANDVQQSISLWISDRTMAVAARLPDQALCGME